MNTLQTAALTEDKPPSTLWSLWGLSGSFPVCNKSGAPHEDTTQPQSLRAPQKHPEKSKSELLAPVELLFVTHHDLL